MSLPIINISSFLNENLKEQENVARQISDACQEVGFFYISDHGIEDSIFKEMQDVCHDFFALPLAEKMKISMDKGGSAWRGYFPLGAELTSGKVDQKEGIYFGTELDPDSPQVISKKPLHGQNLWPEQSSVMEDIITQYMSKVTRIAQAVLEGIALSLNLDKKYFLETYTQDPTVLFRVFNYPPSEEEGETWGVGEHTDYGLLTLLAQDHHGGLEVFSQNKWISAPPLKNCLVCNIGDMLDKLTGGLYVSTPHRVQTQKNGHRLSFPLFLDPNFDAKIVPLPNIETQISDRHRWDEADLHSFKGSYGEYLLGKVSKVFPDLKTDVL